jgi:GSH-dependent disulfide-bond oxidoreductase
VRTYKWSGVKLDGLDHLQRWNQAMYARPACLKGIEVPVKLPSLDEASEATEQFVKGARTMVQR